MISKKKDKNNMTIFKFFVQLLGLFILLPLYLTVFIVHIIADVIKIITEHIMSYLDDLYGDF